MEYKGVTIYQTPEETDNIRKLVRETKSVPGVTAEVGVFQGASAAIIKEETRKELWLFDTFNGFPNSLDESDCRAYYVGDCKAPEEYVQRLMKGKKNVHIVVGEFPKTADPIKDKKFSFVHIDVDIYNSTKEALEFFSHRMSPGGIILVHDYPAHPGVKKAVQESGLDFEVLGLGGRQGVWKMT